MDELKAFRERANAHGICSMANMWDKVQSKKQLMDLAMSIQGIEFIAHAIHEGWAPDVSFIANEFSRFINEGYMPDMGGYSSAWYYNPQGDINIKTSTALIFGQAHRIVVDRICELYIVNCDVELVGKGRAVVHLFNSKIENSDAAPCVVVENK